jgi:hypothetical protein
MKFHSRSVIAGALALAFASSAVAGGKPAQTILVQPTALQCSWSQGNAASGWDDSNTNAPNPTGSIYGGGLNTTVKYGWSCDTNGVITSGSGTLNVETDLSTDLTAPYHYVCSGVAPSATCTGVVDGAAWWTSVTSALDATAGANCPSGNYSHTTDGADEGFSVSGSVKSMIPGRGNGPQNYTQTTAPCTYAP